MTVLAAVEGSDVLTDVLAAMRLRGRLFCRSRLSAPWGLRMREGEAHFHLVEAGSCILQIAKGQETETVELAEGDFLVLPHRSGHLLKSDPRATAQPVERLAESASRHAGFAAFRHGGGGDDTVLVCGSFRFEGDPAAHPLLGLLPPYLVIRAGNEETPTLEWLKTSLRFLKEEARQPIAGTEALISRLIEILFVQVLRLWIESQPVGAGGWLGALRDPQLSKALGAIHQAPGEAWTLASLAEKAGMSRSSFAARFTARIGEAPLAYLTRWRMQLAAEMLRQQALSVGEVSRRVGYESEAGFRKAFSRQFEKTPGELRRQPGPAELEGSAATA